LFGHGTAMASIMVAHPILLGITGLAPEAGSCPRGTAARHERRPPSGKRPPG